MFILCGNYFYHRVQNFLGPFTLNESECEVEGDVTKVQVSNGSSTPTILTTDTKEKFRFHNANRSLTGKMFPCICYSGGTRISQEGAPILKWGGMSSYYSDKFVLKLRKLGREGACVKNSSMSIHHCVQWRIQGIVRDAPLGSKFFHFHAVFGK